MVVGVIIGEFAPGTRSALDIAKFNGVSIRACLLPSTFICIKFIIAIAIGLIVMMWPVLTKVQYEKIPRIFSTSRIWTHIGLSLFLNWIIAPFLMLGLAWATLPDLPNYREGVILVGLGRCIAMVMIWIDLARGDSEYGAILTVINAILQIILFSPLAILFLDVIGGNGQAGVHVSYGNVAISVLIVRSILYHMHHFLTPCRYTSTSEYHYLLVFSRVTASYF